MNDPFDLQRFVDAQASTHESALAELKSGRKQSHWMWFVFPQLAGLGHSDMARRYGISGRDEATAYLQHSVLGERLARCCEALLQWKDRSAMQIMGSPDDMKLRSSMTLFAAVAPDQAVFRDVLEAFFGGKPDSVTLSKLA
ncbi:DUF1810 domain-containing protein [Pseudomonas petrae]|uniref:DUF1810 domain-containing protein n=1 Tax=Pseudomonas petrae TaxID=2912190 RepID=A0ABS9I2P5_9PSED|nr:DUF1810 domain-containing protein [Pseudomonas petrae]MCF7531246.1 DUF1810 domain-containing protein [Pseudomonas petrae]MCF7540084.1 DUF1810 domain-containing protein [Pseudomonas petrae]MCF7542049.1 DUF1810 domain-containing protein [Pseudomonas petrae]MCF7554616.1 DUF1810 domain-containing protein [Pseudomonas petrae]